LVHGSKSPLKWRGKVARFVIQPRNYSIP
jgi:hypothetical protein